MSEGRFREKLNITEITYADGTKLDVVALFAEAWKEYDEYLRKWVDEDDFIENFNEWKFRWFGTEYEYLTDVSEEDATRSYNEAVKKYWEKQAETQKWLDSIKIINREDENE